MGGGVPTISAHPWVQCRYIRCASSNERQSKRHRADSLYRSNVLIEKLEGLTRIELAVSPGDHNAAAKYREKLDKLNEAL